MMKKITLLILLFTISFTGFSQTWDFNDNTTQGWSGNAGGTLTENGTQVTFSWALLGKKPKVGNAATNIDADANKILKVVILNNTEMTELKMRHLKQDASNRFVKYTISANSNTFETYYFNLTNKYWVSTQNEIDFIFSVGGSASTGAGSLEIDEIAFVSTIPTTLQETYTFDTDDDTEGFSATAGSVSGPTGGILTFTPDVNKFAKLNQLNHHVNATMNKYIRITLKNNSALNNQLRFVFEDDGANIATTQEMSVSDAAEVTYYFDMSAEVKWSGNKSFTIGIGSIDGEGKPLDNGTVEFNSILINSTTLSVNDVDFKDDVSITLFPNPVNDIFRVDSPLAIEKIEVFNLLGQKSMTVNSNIVDASTLASGMYIIKITQENNVISTKRFIK